MPYYTKTISKSLVSSRSPPIKKRLYAINEEAPDSIDLITSQTGSYAKVVSVLK